MKTPKQLKPRLLQCQVLIDQGCCLLPCGANKNPLNQVLALFGGLLP